MAPQNVYFTPQRMRGSRSLKHIPPEIYLEIFDLLRPGPFSSFSTQEHKAILSKLMLVCHFFRDVCAPRRYSLLQIKGSQKRHVDFCDAVRKSPRQIPDTILAHVKELHFSDWFPPTSEHKWVVQGLLKVYSTTIDKLPNVTSISLVCVSIDIAFFDAVSEMQNLREVEFTKCAFQPLSGKQPANTKTTTQLTKFAVIEGYDFETYLPRFKALASSPSLTSFTTTHNSVAKAVLKGTTPLDNLKALSMPYDNIDNALTTDVLSRARNLESLSFPFAQDPATLAKERPPIKTQSLCVPPSALHKLRKLQCPSWLVKDFVVDRPMVPELDISAELAVGRACMNDHDAYATPRILDALRDSTKHIRSLAIGVNALAHKNEDKAKKFCIGDLESLETLKLFVSLSWDFSDLRPGLLSPSRPHIHTTVANVSILMARLNVRDSLDGDVYSPDVCNFNLRLQHKMITKFWAEAFPGAQTISFNNFFMWQKIPLSAPKASPRPLSGSQSKARSDPRSLAKSVSRISINGVVSHSNRKPERRDNFEWSPVAVGRAVLKERLTKLCSSHAGEVQDIGGCLEGLWEGGCKEIPENVRDLLGLGAEDEEESATEKESVTEEESDAEE